MMKKIAVLAALLSFGGAAIQPALAEAPICLKLTQIDRTTVVNPKTILFRMKDGKVYRSDLRTPCLGLRFNGFQYSTSYDEVCGGQQTIRVLSTNEICQLGRFTPEKITHG
ncbi:MAG: hypothetical protein JSR60_00195 [Proteobacteria bacterium]|nr:hypothetical protein [Pseudomonadota bacterium]